MPASIKLILLPFFSTSPHPQTRDPGSIPRYFSTKCPIPSKFISCDETHSPFALSIGYEANLLKQTNYKKLLLV